MLKNCTLYVDDQPYEAIVTDYDAMFFMTLLVKDMDSILTDESGLYDAFTQMSAEHNEQLEMEMQDKDEEEASGLVVQRMWERLIVRINHNTTIRYQLCERICNICPDLEDAGIVSYSSRTHTDHSREIKAILRIGPVDMVVGVFGPVIDCFNQEEFISQTENLNINMNKASSDADDADDADNVIDVKATTTSPAKVKSGAKKAAKRTTAKKTTAKKTTARGGKAPTSPKGSQLQVTEAELEEIVQDRLAKAG